MPLISDPNVPIVNRFIQQITQQYASIQSLLQNVYNFIWNNVDGNGNVLLAPQDALNYFGENAGDLLNIGAALIAMLTTYTTAANPQAPNLPVDANGNQISMFVPVTYTVGVNPDGTTNVTATAKLPPPGGGANPAPAIPAVPTTTTTTTTKA